MSASPQEMLASSVAEMFLGQVPEHVNGDRGSPTGAMSVSSEIQQSQT
jgi:hypothetical protein